MSGLDLRALREAAEAATPGPWGFGGGGVATAYWDGMREEFLIAKTDWTAEKGLTREWLDRNLHNGSFIAAANPTAVLALLDRVEAAEGAVERVRALAEFWTDADGEPATDRDLTVLNVTNRHGSRWSLSPRCGWGIGIERGVRLHERAEDRVSGHRDRDGSAGRDVRLRAAVGQPA